MTCRPDNKVWVNFSYRATSHNEAFAGKTWVAKRYLPEALKTIDDTGQTAEIHTVQRR